MTTTQPKPKLDIKWTPEPIRDKVIFLDVDGVLNSMLTDRIYHGYIFVDTGKVAVLRELVNRTHAQIVLSSTWREDYYWAKSGGVQQTYNLFELLRSELAAQSLYISDVTSEIWNYRGLEIKDYLDEHPQIQHFVILDDDDCYPLKQYQVQTVWKYGLMHGHLKLAEQIIQKDYSPQSNYAIRENKIGNQYFTYYKDGTMVQGLTPILNK